MNRFDPKSVFSPRVDNYIKYRPGYPIDVLDILIKEIGLNPNWCVADIGSGTGLLARLFLDLGCTVIGVEPNDEMRQAGERVLAGYPRFSSLPGSAEATGITDARVNLVSAGMAFHWFNIPRAKAEFRRILIPGGWVALVWHRMLTGPEPFNLAYTGLVLEFSPEWTETLRRDKPGSPLDLPGFFGGVYQRTAIPIHQALDWNGLCGRTLSIAHVPQPGAPAHQRMFSRLRDVFERYQQNGQVKIHYETELYHGSFK